jgi:hypothetical protein
MLSSSTKLNLDDAGKGKRRKYDGMGFHDFLPPLPTKKIKQTAM